MRTPFVLALLLTATATARQAGAQSLLIPEDKTIPPLAMVSHRVEATIEEQVAVTRVEQTFRNHTARPLEATYLFPVPRGASVREFAMWVDGKRVKGELVEAAKAKQIYTDIVRRLKDPGLLEYIGSDLLQLQVFPVPAKGDQKIEVSYTSLARKDLEVIEYVYPIRTDGKATRTLEDFSLIITLKSERPILNVYSPTHAISLMRPSDRKAVVGFEKNQCLLDKDFQLLYTVGGGDIGLTSLVQHADPREDGHFLFLISPRAELSKAETPRDIVFVLDTSGSMAENGKHGRIEQARKALRHCLNNLAPRDRFALIQFATTVNHYGEGLVPATRDEIDSAKKWVEKLHAVGGTAIDDALQAALALQDGSGRPFTIAFFTDGKPTIGETVPDKILEKVAKKNTKHTRIFTFGVGNGVNAAFLDQLAETTRAASVYVRPDEDLELKVSGFFAKISKPALTNVHVAAIKGARMVEVYPPRLPDLFFGDQLVVAGRYQGEGATTIRVTGLLAGETREFDYVVDFPARSVDRPFVEEVWARRKVGYLLDQIRLSGEKKELVDEVVTLAKKYGIATPYTSWLIVPDMPVPIVPPPIVRPPWPPRPLPRPPILLGADPKAPPRRVAEVASGLGAPDHSRSKFEEAAFSRLPADARGDGYLRSLIEAKEHRHAYDAARSALHKGMPAALHSDKLGVDLSVRMANLKNVDRASPNALRRANGRSLVEIGGLWVDERFDAKQPMLVVKAMSEAYFRILEIQPAMKDVFQLGNHLVWVAPNGTALVVDEGHGRETLPDEEIRSLFK